MISSTPDRGRWLVANPLSLWERAVVRAENPLMAFRCAHRGTQLSTGWVEGDDLRCFYHGWKYAPDGQCVEQPAEPEPFCQKIRIRSYPVREYLGLIFAYLGDEEPPEFPHYPEWEAEGVLTVRTYPRPCNFFSTLENDPVHTFFVHPSSTPPWLQWGGEVPTVTATESEWGMMTRCAEPGRPPHVSHRGMPNIVIRKVQGDGRRESSTLAWRVPADDTNHWTFQVNYSPLVGLEASRYHDRQAATRTKHDLDPLVLAKEILAGSLRLQDVDGSRTEMTTLEDHVSILGQGTIADREHERLARTDVGVILWRKMWSRELRALSEGHPLKQWARTREMIQGV